MSKYTPTTDRVKEWYTERAEFDNIHEADGIAQINRWLAQHEQELREQIAREIEANISGFKPPLKDELPVGYYVATTEAARIARKGRDND